MSDISGAITRSLTAIAIEEPQAVDDSREALASLEGGDMAQCVQFAINGTATADAAWASTEVRWQYPFFQHLDKTRTDSALDNPTASFGIELHTDAPVVIFVAVRDWIESDEGWQIGARLRVACFAPGAVGEETFSGMVHCTFLGWAAPAEEEDEMSGPVNTIESDRTPG